MPRKKKGPQVLHDSTFKLLQIHRFCEMSSTEIQFLTLIKLLPTPEFLEQFT